MFALLFPTLCHGRHDYRGDLLGMSQAAAMPELLLQGKKER